MILFKLIYSVVSVGELILCIYRATDKNYVVVVISRCLKGNGYGIGNYTQIVVGGEALEGKKRQAQGNAIERLGKNVIGFRAALLTESIFPFICFGDGCDFDESSSIPDRVRTIAMFGNLNTVYLHNNGPFNRGTFFFRPTVWSREEMYQHCLDIAERSILYYLSKYGKTHFQQTPSRTSFEG